MASLIHCRRINFNVSVSSELRYFWTLRTLYTLSDRAHDGDPVRNGARNNRTDGGQVCPN